GLAGGGDAQCGAQFVVRRDGRREALPGKAVVHLEPGDRLLVETPGGGGYGPEMTAPGPAPADFAPIEDEPR
ncbi:MAG TPA: hydantoinase B/oxoprolinase family protein, partial [Limnochordia bacterium]|nr:hydantoinase B/oxoprolinase family protein [Limnochordia bacterium]